jgi:hypothetical protein
MKLSFARLSVVQRNAELLTSAMGVPRDAPPDHAYRRALNSLQGWTDRPDAGTALFFQGGTHADASFSHFLTGYDIPPVVPFEAADTSVISAAIDESLDLLHRLDADARATFDFLIHALLVVRIPAFGSLSDALGWVLAGPEATWSRLEMAELLWHEALHQALFLFDLVDPIFRTDGAGVAAAAASVLNPVLGEDRPYDLAFHGVAVSLSIVDLHLRAGSVRHAEQLLSTLSDAVDHLTALRGLLTARGVGVLEELEQAQHTLARDLSTNTIPVTEYPGERPTRRSYLDLQPAWRPGT